MHILGIFGKYIRKPGDSVNVKILAKLDRLYPGQSSVLPGEADYAIISFTDTLRRKLRALQKSIPPILDMWWKASMLTEDGRAIFGLAVRADDFMALRKSERLDAIYSSRLRKRYSFALMPDGFDCSAEKQVTVGNPHIWMDASHMQFRVVSFPSHVHWQTDLMPAPSSLEYFLARQFGNDLNSNTSC